MELVTLFMSRVDISSGNKFLCDLPIFKACKDHICRRLAVATYLILSRRGFGFVTVSFNFDFSCKIYIVELCHRLISYKLLLFSNLSCA